MTRMSRRLSAVAIAGWVMLSSAPLVRGQAVGWTQLFDGKSLQGWRTLGDAKWEVVDGAIQATAGAGFLVTPVSYADFQITLEFWVTDDANSGVFIRCADGNKVTAENSYEVNIFDQRPDPAYRTGAIVNVAKPATMISAGGKWNTYDITARGSKLTVVLNGVKTVDIDDTKFARGPIALQRTAGTVKFRNVRIRQL